MTEGAAAETPAKAAAAAKCTLDLVKLKEGDKIAGWTVLKKLGEGGFGAVYKVKDNGTGEYALKTEKANEIVRVLKMEVVVLQKAQKAHCKHFCDIFDAGNVGNYNYVVMSLVGASLHDLRKAVPAGVQKFSMGCATSVSMQCMDAVQELHSIGFLHRDIKPGNFAIGCNDPRKIYVLDFGMCRRYLDEKGQVRLPRWAAGFRGTMRYAPISAHVTREFCRKDDLETWLYQTIELTRGVLPWKALEQHLDVVRQLWIAEFQSAFRFKMNCRGDGLQDLFGGCPRELVIIMRYIDSLTYYDTPDYARIRHWMRQALENNNLQEFPYDWEPASSEYLYAKKNPHNKETDCEL